MWGSLLLSFRFTDKTTRLEILIGNSGRAGKKLTLFLEVLGSFPKEGGFETLGLHVKELVGGGSVRIFKSVTLYKINQMSF